jgi:hypothetical protein
VSHDQPQRALPAGSSFTGSQGNGVYAAADTRVAFVHSEVHGSATNGIILEDSAQALLAGPNAPAMFADNYNDLFAKDPLTKFFVDDPSGRLSLNAASQGKVFPQGSAGFALEPSKNLQVIAFPSEKDPAFLQLKQARLCVW